MRKYTTVDLLCFHRWANEERNKDKKGIELIKEYNKEFPELTADEKLKNLIRFVLGID